MVTQIWTGWKIIKPGLEVTALAKTVLQLDLFHRKEGKWTEVPYVQLFLYLRDYPKEMEECKLNSQTLVVVHSRVIPEPPKKGWILPPPALLKEG